VPPLRLQATGRAGARADCTLWERQVTSDNWLAIFMVATVVFAVWLHLTKPKDTNGID